jgi:hypothetical protein
MLRELKNVFNSNILLQNPLDSRNPVKNLSNLNKIAPNSLGQMRPVAKSRNNQEQGFSKSAKGAASEDKCKKQAVILKLTKG